MANPWNGFHRVDIRHCFEHWTIKELHRGAFNYFSLFLFLREPNRVSRLLLNAAVEFALHSWKSRPGIAGIHPGQQSRVTNIRYVDDLVLYNTSFSEMTQMPESLVRELKETGLQRKSQKTKILRAAATRGLGGGGLLWPLQCNKP